MLRLFLTLLLFQADSSTTFKGFKGFSLTTAAGSSATATFSGFGKSGAFPGLTNGNAASTSTHAAGEGRLLIGPCVRAFTCLTDIPLVSSGPLFGSSASDVQAKQTNGATSQSSASCSSAEYNKQLTALNCSVRDWIAKHVNDNPLCDLNPIFRDYERHLASIERQYGAAPAGAASEDKLVSPPPPPPPPLSSTSSSSTTLFSFSKSAPEVKPPPGVTFNFGQKVDSSLLASQPPPPAFSFTSSSQSSLFGGAAALSRSRSEEAPPTAGMAAADVPGVERNCWKLRQRCSLQARC